MTSKNAPLIANYIVDKISITPIQINKLVFFSHAWFLGIYEKPLITETVEAWKYGPVIPSIYHMFKYHQKETIEYNEFYPEKLDKNFFTEDEKSVMDQVIGEYSSIDGGSLISITHQEGSPWEQVYQKGEHYTVIPDDIIKKYYKEKYDNLEE